MGMFDYIKLTVKCPKCGELVSGFQSKDDYCLCEIIDVTKVDYCYSRCTKCGVVIDVSYNKKIERDINGYVIDTIKDNLEIKNMTRYKLTDYIMEDEING